MARRLGGSVHSFLHFRPTKQLTANNIHGIQDLFNHAISILKVTPATEGRCANIPLTTGQHALHCLYLDAEDLGLKDIAEQADNFSMIGNEIKASSHVSSHQSSSALTSATKSSSKLCQL